MERKDFIKTLTIGAASMTTIASFNKFADNLKETGYIMPALFIGHGSPMNGIEDNEFSRR